MAAGDIYRARVQYMYLNQELENVFHYRQLTGVCSSLALANQIDIDIVPAIQDVQNEQTEHKQIIVINLDDTSDFETFPTSGFGTRTGSNGTPFVSWGYLLETTDRKLRSGGKRFGGLSEDDVASGLAEAGVLTALAALGIAMTANLETATASCEWEMVLHREATIEPPADAITVRVDNVIYKRVTTQSSRKFPA